MMAKNENGIHSDAKSATKKTQRKDTKLSLSCKSFRPEYQIYTHSLYVRTLAMCSVDHSYRENWLRVHGDESAERRLNHE